MHFREVTWPVYDVMLAILMALQIPMLTFIGTQEQHSLDTVKSVSLLQFGIFMFV